MEDPTDPEMNRANFSQFVYLLALADLTALATLALTVS